MRVRLIGVHRVRMRLKTTGQLVEYHYAFRGGPRIWKTGDPHGPGTPGYLDAVAKGEAPAKTASAGLFRAVIRDYTESLDFRKLAPRTQADYQIWLGRIDAEFGDAPKEAFNRPGIRAEVLEWRDRWSGKQAQYAWTVIRRVVSWAYDRKKLGEHHLRGGGQIYEANRADIVWPEGAFEAFAKVAPGPETDALEAALETGMRPSDLCALTRLQVLPTPGGQRISVKTAKRGRMASIPVTPRMAAIIERAPATGPILRNASGKPWLARYLSQRIKAFGRKAGLDDALHLHDTRGTACTRLFLAGATLQEISVYFGWSPRHASKMIEIYASLNPAVADAIRGKLAAAL